MLTGKCKEDFHIWYINRKDIHNAIKWFEQQHLSMQFGVYMDFFDINNIVISITEKGYVIINNLCESKFKLSTNETSLTRQQAREQAITKANKIYNDNLT